MICMRDLTPAAATRSFTNLQHSTGSGDVASLSVSTAPEPPTKHSGAVQQVPRPQTLSVGRSVVPRLRLRTARLGGNLRPLTRTLRRLLFSVLFILGLKG